MSAPPRLVALLSIAMALAGCRYRPPEVRVAEATFVAATDEAIALDITLNLRNPSRDPLELRTFEYSFWVDGKMVYRGLRSAEATLSAAGSKQISVPAVIRFDLAGWDAVAPPAETEWMIWGSLVYLTPGELAEILLDSGVRKPRVWFSGSGAVGLVAEGTEAESDAPLR